MPISSVDDFVSAVADVSPDMSVEAPETDPWRKPVSWGPATSLSGQDAFSRLGVEVGMPTPKTAFHKTASAEDVNAMVKEAFLGAAAGWAARGAAKLAPKLLGGAAKAGKGLARMAKAAPGAAARGGKKVWRGGRKVMDVMEQQMPSGGWADRLTGFGEEAASVGYDLSNALSHNF